MPEAPAQSHVFGGGATDSVLSPIVLVAMLIAIALILFLPRKYVIVPVLCFTFLVPMGQQVYIAGVHWLALRIIILVGLVRLLRDKLSSHRPVFSGGFTSIDKAFLYCVLCEAVCLVLQYMQAQALVNQIGFLIDFLGGYFLLRFLVRDLEDIYTVLKCLAVLSLVLGICMVREQTTLQNIFGVLGGVRDSPEVREGKIRSQGVFQHSLMAGTFAATLVPLFVLLWKNGKARIMAVVGMIGCTAMTITSQSSTPLLGYVAGVVAICLWPIRKSMKMVRWGIVIALIILAMVMKAPVWFVIAHIDLTGGSSGYHRAELIDQFIRHFREWWLIGTKDAGTWAYDLWDTQNQYVNVGETGGITAFAFFITVITRSYSQIGKARKKLSGLGGDEWLPWFLGAAIFAHLVCFFGVNYFDQSKIGWFLVLSMVPVVASKREAVRRQIETVDLAVEKPDIQVAQWQN